MSVYNRVVRGTKQKTFSVKFRLDGKWVRKSGFLTQAMAKLWEANYRTAHARGELGIVKVSRDLAIDPLIEGYVDRLYALKRSPDYCYNTQVRLKKLAREVPWGNLGDVTARGFERWRASRPTWRSRVLGARTLNQYLDHCLEFGGWLVDEKRLPVNPFAGVKEMTALPNDGYRRAATPDELRKLLAAASPDRRLVYLFALYVPIRRGALEQIRWGDLELTGDKPTLTVRAEIAKSRYASKLPIRADLVPQLAAIRGDATDEDLVFPRVPTIDQLREDLKAAGVAFDDGKGSRRLDLHAFRKTVVRLLKSAGVSLDQAQLLLQHRDSRTTRKHYDDDLVDPILTDAAEKIPEFGVGAR